MPLQPIDLQTVFANSGYAADFGRIRAGAEYLQNISGKAIAEENHRLQRERLHRLDESQEANKPHEEDRDEAERKARKHRMMWVVDDASESDSVAVEQRSNYAMTPKIGRFLDVSS